MFILISIQYTIHHYFIDLSFIIHKTHFLGLSFKAMILKECGLWSTDFLVLQGEAPLPIQPKRLIEKS